MVKYVFEMDPNAPTAKLIHANNGLPRTSGLIGGSCLEVGIIHLYCWGDLTYLKNYFGNEDKVWSDLIEHEHLHNLLSKNGIPEEFHHEIMDRMEGMHMHRRDNMNKGLSSHDKCTIPGAMFGDYMSIDIMKGCRVCDKRKECRIESWTQNTARARELGAPIAPFPIDSEVG